MRISLVPSAAVVWYAWSATVTSESEEMFSAVVTTIGT